MRDVGDKVRFQRFDAAQLCDHSVDVVDHEIQIVLFFLVMQCIDANSKITLRDLLCGIGDCLHRRIVYDFHPGANQPGEKDGDANPVQDHDMCLNDRHPPGSVHADNDPHADPGGAKQHGQHDPEGGQREPAVFLFLWLSFHFTTAL